MRFLTGGGRKGVGGIKGVLGRVGRIVVVAGIVLFQLDRLGLQGGGLRKGSEQFGLQRLRGVGLVGVGLSGSNLGERRGCRAVGDGLRGLNLGSIGRGGYGGIRNSLGFAAFGSGEGFGRSEFSFRGIGCLRDLGDFKFFKNRLIGFGERGLGEFAEKGGGFGRFRDIFSGIGGRGLDLDFHGLLLELGVDGNGLGVLLWFELRDIEVRSGLFRLVGKVRLRDLGFFRNALKSEFLFAEGIDTDEDVGRRIALLLDFLGDHEESEEDEQKEVGSRRPGQALVEEAGDVTPALKEIDEGDEGSEGEEDPPADRAQEILELFPAGEVGVADHLAGGGAVESIVGSFPGGVRFVVRAEDEVEAIHPHGGIGYVSVLDIEVNLFGFEGFAIHHTAEVDSVAPVAAAVAVGGEEDMLAPPGEGGLHIVLL